jgi:hypothetical protein
MKAFHHDFPSPQSDFQDVVMVVLWISRGDRREFYACDH